MNSRLFVFFALVSYALAVPPKTADCEKKPCGDKKPGDTFCQGGGIMTCNADGSVSGKDCGLSFTPSGKRIVGKCQTISPSQAKCVQPEPCEYQPAGFKYCQGEQGIATCLAGGKYTAVDCGLAVSASGKQIIGKCKTNKDGSGSCYMPERCDYEAPGFRYCKGDQSIATCHGPGKVTAVDCGLAVSASGKQIIGKCRTNKDGSGSCYTPEPCEYEAAGFTYCKGDGIITCLGGGKAKGVDCPNGTCATVNGKATCQSKNNNDRCKGKKPGTYCDNGRLLKCPEDKCSDCPKGQKCSSKGPDDRNAQCTSSGSEY